MTEYLPDEALLKPETFGDRHFLWGILFTIRNDWASKTYEQIMQMRNVTKPKVSAKQIV